jgi:hypothetical protein
MFSFHGVYSDKVAGASTIELQEHCTTTMTKNTIIDSRYIRKESIGGNSLQLGIWFLNVCIMGGQYPANKQIE